MSTRTSSVRRMGLCGLAVVVALAASLAGQVVTPAVQSPPTAPPRDRINSAPTGTARIRGRIVHAGTGAPLRRAEVTLTGEQNVRRQVTTNSEGRYEFTELPSGRFTVGATKGGYLTLRYGQRRPFEPGRPIALAAAQVLSQVDLALPRGSVITGRITDDRGAPVVGADIRVERYQYGPEGERRLNRVPIGALATNDLGEFRAFGLMPGEYVVSANVRQMPQLPGQAGPIGPAQGLLPTYYPGTTNVAEAQTVLVGIAEEASAQFGLASGRTSRVSGTILDSTGRPAAGANLMLTTTSGGFTSGMGAGTAAADGSFSIVNISPGEHYIQVRHQSRTAGAAVSEVANVPISTTGEDVTGFGITTSAGTTVVGRVEWKGNAPRTGGPSDTRLRIMANAADRRPAILGAVGSTDPAANGAVGQDNTFRIAGILGTVLFAPVGVPPQWTLKAVIVNGTDVTSVGTDASSLGGDAPVRVVLTDKVTELSGSVRNAKREPVGEYVVVVLPEDPVESSVAVRYTRTVRPDQSGTFRVRALPPGSYRAVAVEALEQGTEWDPAFQATVRPAARRFTLNEGQTLTLDLDLLP